MSASSHIGSNELTPESLVARIGAGDKQAEELLVQRFSRPLLTMLERRTGDIQRAEDAHQEAFRIVLERLRSNRSIDDPEKVSSFIQKTAVNVLLGEYRKEARRQTYADTDLIQRHMDKSSDQLRELIDQESSSAIRAAILAISNERDRELLYRFYILQEEKPIICKVLRLTSEHFDRVISRARTRFRKSIEKNLILGDFRLGGKLNEQS